MPFLGTIVDAAVWRDPTSLAVKFRSSHAGMYHQLYAGRTLVGATASTTARTFVGTVRPGAAPQHLQVVAVTASELAVDFGRWLPLRPYNRVRLTWTAASFPSDTKHFEIRAGLSAGAAVTASNVLARVPFRSNKTAYEWLSEPLDESGVWNFEVVAIDDKPADGNAGTGLPLSAAILAHPPDVVPDAAGNRLTAAVSGGNYTVDYTRAA